jgi:hypothetical protein
MLPVWPMIKALFGNAPWRMFGHVEEKRAYCRNVALVLIRTGGHCFSIRHLQYFMPNVRNACRIWGWMNGVPVSSEEVALLGNGEETSADGQERNAWIHWIGPTPPHAGIVSGGDQMMETKALLHIHGEPILASQCTSRLTKFRTGGGFVLPPSNGCVHMTRNLLGEVNSTGRGSPIYLALAEYSEYLAPCRNIVRMLTTTSNFPIRRIPDPNPPMRHYHRIPPLAVWHRPFQPCNIRRLLRRLHLPISHLPPSSPFSLPPTTLI